VFFVLYTVGWICGESAAIIFVCFGEIEPGGDVNFFARAPPLYCGM
jgi:hypothetical protein